MCTQGFVFIRVQRSMGAVYFQNAMPLQAIFSIMAFLIKKCAFILNSFKARAIIILLGTSLKEATNDTLINI